MINIKNYTSSVPAVTSINRIESLLVEVGATDINKKYEDGKLKAISFMMLVEGRPIPFKLPARIHAVFDVLWSQYKRPQPGTKERVRAQAERTAWKILHEWTQIQISLIQLKQADFMELFLPHVYDHIHDKSYYTILKESKFRNVLQLTEKT